MRSRVLSFLLLWATVAACGGGGVSYPEYAAELEVLVNTMNDRLDSLDAAYDSNPSLDNLKAYAGERVAARYDFVEGIGALEPPDDAAEMHAAAIGIMTRLADAEALLAERVSGLTTNVGVDSIWDTPEGRAARAVDQEAVDLCLSAQSDFDKTQLRAELGDVPWVPPEMKEVIIVTFGCLAEER